MNIFRVNIRKNPFQIKIKEYMRMMDNIYRRNTFLM